MTAFPAAFQALTDYQHLRWHKRLFEHFVHEEAPRFPGVIDIPTGLAKTMVMAIWLIARAMRTEVPTRLIYVVDRRTVVDQATDLAEKFRKRLQRGLSDPQHGLHDVAKSLSRQETLDGTSPLAISTLRGQLADNREWSRDPSRPAIVIGTVDLIGSALLFSGYRSSYKRRPLEAGLLGQDSLLVLDEAHLSRPFDKLLGSIEEFNRRGYAGKPMRVIRMTATSARGSVDDAFQLEGDFEKQSDDFADDVVRDRYSAAKRLCIRTLGEKEKLTERLAREAIALADDSSVRGKRIVVFVRRPEDANAAAEGIRKHVAEMTDDSGPKPKRVKHKPFENSVSILTGAMRGLERDRLIGSADAPLSIGASDPATDRRLASSQRVSVMILRSGRSGKSRSLGR